MSAANSPRLPKLAQSALVDEEGTLGPVPPPIPADPAMRAELRERLKRGLASAEAGVGEDWEVVHARVRASLNLPPL